MGNTVCVCGSGGTVRDCFDMTTSAAVGRLALTVDGATAAVFISAGFGSIGFVGNWAWTGAFEATSGWLGPFGLTSEWVGPFGLDSV